MTYGELFEAWAHAQNLVRMKLEIQAKIAGLAPVSPHYAPRHQELSKELADIRRQLDEKAPG